MTLKTIDFVRTITFDLQKLLIGGTVELLGEFNFSTFGDTFSIVCEKEDSVIIAKMLTKERYDFIERNNGDGNQKLMVHMGWEED